MKGIDLFKGEEMRLNLNSIYGGRKEPTHTQVSTSDSCIDYYDEYNTRTQETRPTRVEITYCQ